MTRRRRADRWDRRPITETATRERPDSLPYEREGGRKATVGMLGFGPKGERERKMGRRRVGLAARFSPISEKKTGRRKKRIKRENK